MANRYSGVIGNSGEDFLDTLVSDIVYQETNNVMKDVKKNLDLKPDSYLDEAIEGALMTLQYGLMNATIIVVTEYVFAKSVVVLTSLIAFIKGRSVVKKTQSTAQKIFANLGSKGGIVGKVLKGAMGAIIGTQEQTLAIANMTNNTSNNIISNIGLERQNQIMLQGQKVRRVDNVKGNLYNTRNKSRDNQMSLYLHKFETGTWKKTAKDKKLYFNCTGQDIKTVNYNSDFVAELNKYSNVVKSAKGEIFSNAKLKLDLITALGASVRN